MAGLDSNVCPRQQKREEKELVFYLHIEYMYIIYIYISLIRSNFILFIFGGAHFCVQLCSLLVGVIVIHVFFWGTISETVGNTFVAKHHLRIEGRNPKSISSAC